MMHKILSSSDFSSFLSELTQDGVIKSLGILFLDSYSFINIKVAIKITAAKKRNRYLAMLHGAGSVTTPLLDLRHRQCRRISILLSGAGNARALLPASR